MSNDLYTKFKHKVEEKLHLLKQSARVSDMTEGDNCRQRQLMKGGLCN